MKKIFFLAAMIVGLKSFSQNVAINTTGNTAHASAMLDVSSTNKGFLTPRMTTLQRTSIISPADGLLVYDTDTKTFWYFSTTWNEINLNVGGGGGSGSFSLPYAGSGNTDASVFSITNTDPNIGSSGIYGRSGAGYIGFNPGFKTGVWGDNSFGYGVLGTSSDGSGVAGITDHGTGVYGSGRGLINAGVYGTNIDSGGVGVMGYLQNGGNAIYGINYGQGNTGRFEANSSNNTDEAVYIVNYGKGRGLLLQNANSTSTEEAVLVNSDGSGRTMTLQGTNANGTDHLFHILNQTKGTSIYVNAPNTTAVGNVMESFNYGLGNGIILHQMNTSGNGVGLQVDNRGTGYGINVSADLGIAASFYTNIATNASTVLKSSSTGTGKAGDFSLFNANNSSPVLSAYTSGTGAGLLIDNENPNVVNSLATFKKSGANKARIDGTGKGFFNGGTQNSGADVAEAFDVTGNIQQYETGDVLVISTDKDRSVEKSSGAYSTLVAGVYATKPGVLLTEENIETDISDKVPMGVVGVIPTKVCLEGGEIKRGDMLVTSSTPGVAMKADLDKVKPGQVIGKALENFNSSSTGKIKVLVSVK